MKYSEIIWTAFVSYFYMVFILRVLGKKELSQLTVLDLIVFLIMSELMTLSIGDENMTILHSMLAVFVIVLIDKICSYLSLKSQKIKKILEGQPCYIIYQGKLDQKKLSDLNYSVNDLCHHLREEGVGSLSDVEFAVLETDGKLSVIEKNQSHYLIPDPLITDGEINKDVLKTLKKDEKWLMSLLKKEGINDYKEVFYCILEDNGLYYINKEKG